MSLGSPKTSEKKKFVPNFNVARVKRDPDEPKVGVKKEGAGGKPRKKQEHKKDKKERPELIQTMGSVFSEVRKRKYQFDSTGRPLGQYFRPLQCIGRHSPFWSIFAILWSIKTVDISSNSLRMEVAFMPLALLPHGMGTSF